MDGPASTLAPIFAAQETWTTFLVGSAAWEGAHPKGLQRSRAGNRRALGPVLPLKLGIASGAMTTTGGTGHALPCLIPDFRTATTIAIVFVELWASAWIRNRFKKTPFLRAVLQVVLGGALVLAAGVLIGGG